MKKYISILILLLSITSTISAQNNKTRGAIAYPGQFEIKQPNGDKITLYKKGDRVINWWETEQGEKVLQKGNWFVFAEIDADGNMQASKRKVESKPSFISRIFGAKQATGEQKIFYSNKQIKNKETSYFSSPSILRSQSQNARVISKKFPTTGNRKMLLILAQFQNKAFNVERNQFVDMMNKENYIHPLNTNSYGSFRDYYLDASFGALDITSTVSVVVTLPHNYEYYGENDPNRNNEDMRMQEFVKDALKEVENSGMDFSQFDNNGDGVVDLVNIIHAGEGEEASNDANTIWSHSHYLYSQNRPIYDGVSFYSYVVNPECMARRTSTITGVGVICHEFGHALGLPDFYDVDYEGSGGRSEGLSEWCLMAGGSWNNGGTNPSMINAFSRERLGWINITELKSTDSKLLKESVLHKDQAYRIKTSESDEYFILENRQKVSHDKHLPGNGMLVYHVDYDQSLWSSNTINITPGEEHMKILHANGVSKREYPFPGAGYNTKITNITNPNLKSNNGINSKYSIHNIVEQDSKIYFNFISSINYNLTIKVESEGRAIADAKVDILSLFNGIEVSQSKNTDASGFVSFYGIQSSEYQYTVSKSAYVTEVSSIKLDNDKTQSIDLKPIESNNKLSFIIKDGSIPIQGVRVEISSMLDSGTKETETQNSDANGYVEFLDINPNKTYAYTIQKAEYNTINREIYFTQSSCINIAMKKELIALSELTIIVKDKNTPIAGAAVSLYDEDNYIASQTTNSFGIVKFPNLSNLKYTCKIIKSYFNPFQSTIFITQDKTEELELDPLKKVSLSAKYKINQSTQPIRKMQIEIKKDGDSDFNVSKLTDGTGKIEKDYMYNGKYTFTATHQSFKPYTGEFMVEKDGQVDFVFYPQSLSMEEIVNKSGKINIYPNPAVDIINIDLQLENNCLIQIYDNKGTLIYENKYAGMLNTINLGGNSPGVYNIIITSGENQFKKKILLK